METIGRPGTSTLDRSSSPQWSFMSIFVQILDYARV